MSQEPSSSTGFGLSIAYLIPGFLALLSVSGYLPAVRAWLMSPPASSPTMGGFLYGTVASLALGLTLSTIRWAVLDRLLLLTGIKQPSWDFSKLQHHLGAFMIAVEHHYRYYQFYGNTLVFLVFLFVFPHPLSGVVPGEPWLHRAGAGALALLFFAASRDTLRKYHDRARAIQEEFLILCGE